MIEPAGITLEDQATGELVHHDRLRLTVWYNGEPRTLRLRLARGILEPIDASSLRET